MQTRSLRSLLILILACGLFGPALAAQTKKGSLVWGQPVSITRKTKPNRVQSAGFKKVQVAPLLTLQWRLLVRGNGNIQQEVDPSQEFSTGDQLKLAITANQDGYLYLISQPEGKDGIIVFPDQRINNGQNLVKRNQELVVPSYCRGVEGLIDPKDCWWRMAPPAGRETFIVVFSRDKIKTLPAAAGEIVKTEIIDELRSGSGQKVEQNVGANPLPGRPNIRFATRVQNTNAKDNEELIATIEFTHGE